MGGVLIFSLIWYYFPKYGGVNWFRGPVPTIIGDEMARAGVAEVEHGTTTIAEKTNGGTLDADLEKKEFGVSSEV